MTTGPLRLQGNTDGAMRFGFSTSLRDVARYAVEREARETDDGTFGLAARRGPAGAPRFNPFDLWIEGKYNSFRDSRSNNDLDGHFGLLSVGADYVLNPSLLVGTVVQFDSMRQRSALQSSDVRGEGWMLGPYATIRLTEHMFWQARAAWGRSSNEVSPFLTYTDKFETDRWLVSSTLTGRWSFGPWVLKPSASVAYMEDVARSYTDTFGAVIPDVKTRLGQAKAGPEVGYRYQVSPDLILEPRAGLQVIWNFAGDTTASGFGQINGENVGPVGVRGRAEVGLRASTPAGIGLDLSGSYDGIGSRGYDAVTGKATIRVPFN